MTRRKVRKLGGQHDFTPNYHGQDLTSLGGLLPPRGNDKPLTDGDIGRLFDPGSGSSGSGNTSTGALPGYSVFDDPLNGDSSWSAILQGVSQDQFADFLSSLGVGYDKGMDDASKANWAQALLNAMLKHYQDQEQRAYDKSVRDEQRIFDSPTNQLARLMGAGISRDAAIQMLAGGSESGLIGSASAGTEGAGSPADASANMLTSKIGIANSVFSGLSAIGSLVGLGFSIPQAVQQTKFLKAQNYMSSSQVRAYDAAGKAFTILNGAKVAADAFGSVSSAGAAISKLAQSGNTDAQQFIASGGLQSMYQNAPFSSNVLGNLYKAERSASDYDKYFDSQIRLQRSQEMLNQAHIESIGPQIANAMKDLQVKDAQIAEVINKVAIGNAQIEVLNAQGEFVKVQSKNYNRQVDAAIRLQSAQSEQLEIQNDVNKVGLDDVKQARLDELQLNAFKWSTYNNEESRNKLQAAWLSDSENAYLAASFKLLYLNAGKEFAQDHPDLYKFLVGVNNSGLFDMVKSTVETGIKVGASFL